MWLSLGQKRRFEYLVTKLSDEKLADLLKQFEGEDEEDVIREEIARRKEVKKDDSETL